MNRKTPTFSKPINDTLIHAALIEEMMRGDGLSDSGDSNFVINKKAFDIYARHANAALRIFHQIEEREMNIKPSEME